MPQPLKLAIAGALGRMGRQMGCEYVQSFMFGAPMPGDQVLKTLKEQYPLTQA